MPIKQFVNDGMGSAEIYRLNLAYAKALRRLHLTDGYDEVTEIVAKETVHVGASGVTDPQEIAEIVVRHFHQDLAVQ